MSERNNLDESQIDAIEGRLAGTLKPITPSTEFVQRLRGRIHLPERRQIVLRLQDWQRLMIAIGSVFSGAVVVLTLARVMYHLFGRRSG